MKPVIYGIPNCDSIRKARKWFDAQGVDYTFVDLRQTPPSPDQVTAWIDAVGGATLVNKRSTTWKNMSDTEKQDVEQGKVLAALLANPTLIKRPVLEYAGTTTVGFSADNYAKQFTA